MTYKQEKQFRFTNELTTPGDNTKISGVRVDESSTTDAMSNTGGSTNLNFESKMTFYHSPSAARNKERSEKSLRHISVHAKQLKSNA